MLKLLPSALNKPNTVLQFKGIAEICRTDKRNNRRNVLKLILIIPMSA